MIQNLITFTMVHHNTYSYQIMSTADQFSHRHTNIHTNRYHIHNTCSASMAAVQLVIIYTSNYLETTY